MGKQQARQYFLGYSSLPVAYVERVEERLFPLGMISFARSLAEIFLMLMLLLSDQVLTVRSRSSNSLDFSQSEECRDAAESDCPQLAALCDESVYARLMRQQCPYTCDYCEDYNESSSSSSSDYASSEYSESGESGPVGKVRPTVYVDHPLLPWSINKQVNPCTDFYAHVCDGYDSGAVLMQGRSRNDSFANLEVLIDDKLISMFLPSPSTSL